MKQYLMLFSMLFSSYSFAEMHPCKVEVLGDLATEDMPNPIPKIGETIDLIVQYYFLIESQEAFFCQKGGFCYPRYQTVNGNNIEVLKLKQCSIGEVMEYGKHTISYKLIPNRSEIPKKALKKHDISNRLADLGIGLAIADNAAEFYINKPNSQCGILTKSVLEGNKEAFETLRDGQKYCNYW